MKIVTVTITLKQLEEFKFEGCIDYILNTDTILLFASCPPSDFKDTRCLRTLVTYNCPIYRGPPG